MNTAPEQLDLKTAPLFLLYPNLIYLGVKNSQLPERYPNTARQVPECSPGYRKGTFLLVPAGRDGSGTRSATRKRDGSDCSGTVPQ